jgi:Phage integrase, N-terminal SAM-like domain
LVFEAARTSVGEYLDRWLEDSVKGSVKHSTYHSYSTEIRRHVIPAFRPTKTNTFLEATSGDRFAETGAVQLSRTKLSRAMNW